MKQSTIQRALLALLLTAATSLSVFAASTTVTVRIDMRGPIREGWFDPATETVGLRGGTPPLSWGVTVPAADVNHDGIYIATVRFDRTPGRSAFVSYKFKVDGTNNPNDGWEADGNRPLPLPSTRSTASRAFNAPGPGFPQTLAAPIRTIPDFGSKYVSPRTITVLLPPGYESARAVRYPVLYMNDGQNLFDARTAHGAEWQIDETAIRMMRAKTVAPIIIVGVASTPDHRVADYTPTAVAEPGSVPPRSAGGSADAYGKFLVEELKPFIDRSFRTKPDAENTGLGGSSLGGLVTMYLGLKYPDTFGRLAVVSPSVWWDDHYLVKQVGLVDVKTSTRIWIDIGTSEGSEAVPDARMLRNALEEKGWSLGTELRYLEVEGGTHDESAWAARFGEALRFLFPPSRRSSDDSR